MGCLDGLDFGYIEIMMTRDITTGTKRGITGQPVDIDEVPSNHFLNGISETYFQVAHTEQMGGHSLYLLIIIF